MLAPVTTQLSAAQTLRAELRTNQDEPQLVSRLITGLTALSRCEAAELYQAYLTAALNELARRHRLDLLGYTKLVITQWVDLQALEMLTYYVYASQVCPAAEQWYYREQAALAALRVFQA